MLVELSVVERRYQAVLAVIRDGVSEGGMQHVRVAKYRVTTGSVDEISDAAKGGMLPLFKDQPGFISYGVADCGDGAVLSVQPLGDPR